MKNYFNQYEASNHLIIMTAMLSVKNLIDGDSITAEEKRILKSVIDKVGKFSDSVFARLGDGYIRSLKHKAELNTLKLVSRNVHHKNNVDMEDFIDSETLHEIINTGADIDCHNCNRTDCKNCGIYRIKSYLHYDGKSDNTDLCPFRLDKLNIPKIDFSEDLL